MEYLKAGQQGSDKKGKCNSPIFSTFVAICRFCIKYRTSTYSLIIPSFPAFTLAFKSYVPLNVFSYLCRCSDSSMHLGQKESKQAITCP